MPPSRARSYAYCSDTLFDETISNYVEGADLLYHESTFSDELLDRAKETFHSTASQAATIAKMAGVKSLLIGHFSARHKDVSPLLAEAKKIFPSTALALEGKKLFSNAAIEVNHDLLGAARALCGGQKGIVAILGTGSNSCLYDGEKITEHIPSLGYILGDEGSGAYIAKNFIASYLYREIPNDLKIKIDAENIINKEDIIQNLYHSPAPSAYLAGFMTTVTKYIQHPFVSALVKNCFTHFLERHICRYSGFKETLMHCTGSVAYNFSYLLKEAASEKKITVGKIIEKPINALADFHLL